MHIGILLSTWNCVPGHPRTYFYSQDNNHPDNILFCRIHTETYRPEIFWVGLRLELVHVGLVRTQVAGASYQYLVSAHAWRSILVPIGFWINWPNRLWGPPILLSNEYWGPLPEGKARPGRDADHSPHLVPRSRMITSYFSTSPKRLHSVLWDWFYFFTSE
jgi:hypothetical protein